MESEYRYKFKDKSLGKGISGEVRLAFDQIMEKEVAAKHIPKNLVNNDKEMQLLTNEILISTDCENDNLAKVYDISNIEGETYLLFEYCNGGDLSSALKQYRLKYGKYLKEEIIQHIILQILNGLQCLHAHNVIHHDIKPANILLKYDNEKDLKEMNFLKCTFKISDFGLSKYKNDQQERMIGGSPLYMEPSLFDRDVTLQVIENEKVDIWALGIMTYELLFDKTPFENTSYIPENAMQELVSNLNKGIYIIELDKINKISLQFIAFLNSCLQFEQSKRSSSEELQFTEFITREIPYFEFVSKNNLTKLPSQYIIGNNIIKLNIRDEKKLNQYLDLL